MLDDLEEEDNALREEIFKATDQSAECKNRVIVALHKWQIQLHALLATCRSLHKHAPADLKIDQVLSLAERLNYPMADQKAETKPDEAAEETAEPSTAEGEAAVDEEEMDVVEQPEIRQVEEEEEEEEEHVESKITAAPEMDLDLDDMMDEETDDEG